MLSFEDREVNVKLFSHDGLNLSEVEERNIMQALSHTDFGPVSDDGFGTIVDEPHLVKRYQEDFLGILNVSAIREARFHLVVDYLCSSTSFVLPSILDDLGCSVVALWEYREGGRLFSREELELGLSQLAAITSSVKADLGVRLDVGGERLCLIDDKGRQVPEVTACAALALLALQSQPSSIIAVYADTPQIFEKIAQQFKGTIIRTKADPTALMATATQRSLIMASDGHGGVIFPQFQPAMDGLIGLAKLMEFLATQHTNLSTVIDNLPM